MTRESGFSLIELLVSMTIMSLIMALVALSVQVMSDGWERGAKAAETHDMIGRTSDLLHRDLSGARRFTSPDGNQPTFQFAGSRTTMTYIVREPPYPTSPGLYLVRLTSAPVRIAGRNHGSATGLALTRSRQPYQSGKLKTHNVAADLASSQLLSDAVPLLGANVPFAFAYRGGNLSTDPWQPDWTNQRRMPTLVRIIIGPLPHGGATPEIIIRLKVDAEPGCVGGQKPVCTIATDGELLKITQPSAQKDQQLTAPPRSEPTR